MQIFLKKQKCPRRRGDADALFPPSADAEKDLTSLERCMADSLLLLAEHQVGDKKLWLLPQSEWQQGETLRQTAERALASLSGNRLL